MNLRVLNALSKMQEKLQESWYAQVVWEGLNYSSVYVVGVVAGRVLYQPIMLPMGALALTTCLSYLAVKLALRHNIEVVRSVCEPCHEFAKRHPYLRVSAIALAVFASVIAPRVGLPFCCALGIFNGIVLSQELNSRKLKEKAEKLNNRKSNIER